MTEPLNNMISDDRQALIAALAARSLNAYEERSGGNVWHVSLYLLQEDQDWLAICSATDETACDVGLMGSRHDKFTGLEATAGERRWESVSTLEAAVAAFARRWVAKEEWIAKFYEGVLDL